MVRKLRGGSGAFWGVERALDVTAIGCLTAAEAAAQDAAKVDSLLREHIKASAFEWAKRKCIEERAWDLASQQVSAVSAEYEGVRRVSLVNEAIEALNQLEKMRTLKSAKEGGKEGFEKTSIRMVQRLQKGTALFGLRIAEQGGTVELRMAEKEKEKERKKAKREFQQVFERADDTADRGAQGV
uniref:Uncharacterized protein n=1 Tax=Chromera velia CCMP2878 TaxID=1169474 RepID=A0A0G4HB01_9ALVE|eukprot:Cvel_25702.t1-p1 / transcript=Cvel_25702.t1 / gene=Cvel_25702 / organism=Chromera_velia_CCMP2878 / gene_product=hypothetical protein / transcript_product=hypothetical protein / location=Cvel_scaffold2949:3400-4484(-) / protein_length=183 / sequence_SO=supercontig / SO=protein_coding / is_pseudo=false